MKVLDLCTGKVDERMQVLDERTKKMDCSTDVLDIQSRWIPNSVLISISLVQCMWFQDSCTRKCGQLYEISGLHPYGNAGRVYVRSGFPVRKFLDYASSWFSIGVTGYAKPCFAFCSDMRHKICEVWSNYEIVWGCHKTCDVSIRLPCLDRRHKLCDEAQSKFEGQNIKRHWLCDE